MVHQVLPGIQGDNTSSVSPLVSFLLLLKYPSTIPRHVGDLGYRKLPIEGWLYSSLLQPQIFSR